MEDGGGDEEKIDWTHDFNNFIENAHHRQKTEMWLVKEEHDERDEEEKKPVNWFKSL
ncbi:hypothetical protein IGI04_038015 [Brassica rapa subsp. trilocularis]|uniref:Uncharacterized protein n=1 Tax=Brassica rapa subsp. trilocularis TaxID=1813537 RepID=A0ABQ7LLP9_BRACM|nr:hypothetical protein IGI04_038015 [Brassica rapa subsp. trilocularis]